MSLLLLLLLLLYSDSFLCYDAHTTYLLNMKVHTSIYTYSHIMLICFNVFWTVDTKTIISNVEGKIFRNRNTHTSCLWSGFQNKRSARLWNSYNKLANQIRYSCWQYWISMCTFLQRVCETWNKIMLGDKFCIHCHRYFTYISPPFCDCKNIPLS
jgi:hypothetical protein